MQARPPLALTREMQGGKGMQKTCSDAALKFEELRVCSKEGMTTCAARGDANTRSQRKEGR